MSHFIEENSLTYGANCDANLAELVLIIGLAFEELAKVWALVRQLGIWRHRHANNCLIRISLICRSVPCPRQDI